MYLKNVSTSSLTSTTVNCDQLKIKMDRSLDSLKQRGGKTGNKVSINQLYFLFVAALFSLPIKSFKGYLYVIPYVNSLLLSKAVVNTEQIQHASILKQS